MNYLLTGLTLLIGASEYFLAYQIFLRERIKKWWLICILISGAYIASVFLLKDRYGKEVDCYAIGAITFVIVILIFTEGNILKRLKCLGIVLGLCLCIEHFSGIIMRLIDMWHVGEVSWFYHVFYSNIITVAILFLVYIVIRKKGFSYQKVTNKFIGRVRLFMVILAAGVIVTIFSIDIILNYVDTQSLRVGMLIIAAISTVCVEGLILLILFLRDAYDQQKQHINLICELSQKEKKYYIDFLKREDETRRLRHDMKKHFMVLMSLSKECNNKKIENYIKSIGVENVFDKICFDTGNDKLNVLTNYYLSQADKDVSLYVEGVVSQNVMDDEAALCVIYGNLIHNAVEAVNRIENIPNREINIGLAEGNQFLKITIANTINRQEKINFKSCKTDKKNHGLGLLNVNDAVGKMNGHLDFIFSEDTITASVILPIEHSNYRMEKPLNGF